MSGQLVAGLDDVGGSSVALAGGKGANLGALRHVEGVRVPDGFCVTTEAYRRVVAADATVGALVDRLSHVDTGDPVAIREWSARVRRAVEGIAVPDELAAAITGRLDEGVPYAVRSSATAEDLPGASFAGQQDTYLNVTGPDEVVRHVRRCWASLFTERAVTYRGRQGIDHRTAHMAVVVQRMVDARVSGVLFTADPVTSDRRVTAVEAVAGLGEALVSGHVNPDVHRVRDGQVVTAPGGVLSAAQVLRLERLGRRIEAHFGRPQDIEWCLAADGFWVVQSRPITTLFPIPEAGDCDGDNRVYLSVGHQQMMTDPMKPLGISFWQMTTPAPMAVAGGRLFVDVTRRLASPSSREAFLEVAAKADPLMADALRTVLERDGFIRTLPDDDAPPPVVATPEEIEPDPAIVTELIRANEESVAAAAREIAAASGEELLDVIRADLRELQRVLFDRRSHQVFMSAMEATWWLNERLERWLGERNAADVLTQSVPHNVTSEMGLALLGVADVVRRHPEAVTHLERAGNDGFLAGLDGEVRAAVEDWLDRYGMRCVGEIDITRPRWAEQPVTLVPLLLGNVRTFEPGAGERRFEQGRREAADRERDLLERLRALPDGAGRAAETKQKIDLVRTFIGYREYPKYGMIRRYFLYKRALLAEAHRLGLPDPEDIFFLTFDELYDVVRTGGVDDELIARRRADFRSYEGLTTPRVLTSDGEVLNGSYRRDDLPAGALAGLPVSAGTVEGRARVVLEMGAADLEPGDILVTTHTDPSWTPLFVAVAGLVTEVGGMMTHGAVVAREYGLPAVVGVADATRLIRDGQRIRVHGIEGYVELLG